MPIKVFRNDIALVKADAIVNSANPSPTIGGGAEASIYESAGKKELLAERKKIGVINPGEVAVTPAFGLSAKYVIHTVGPIWEGGSHGEAAILRSCYENALELAMELGCKSIAFPFISTGTYGFPRDKAIEIANSAICKFLKHNEITVILVVFDKESLKISAKKYTEITAYIDSNYIDSKYNDADNDSLELRRKNRLLEVERMRLMRNSARVEVPNDISEMLKSSSPSFSERVLSMVNERGLEPSELYKKSGALSKKIYSDMKVQGDNYHPKKGTAIAFCLALELDLTETIELLESAGWTLSDSKRQDIIIKWHINKHDYNIRHVNDTLLSYGFTCLDKYDK